MPRIPRDLHSPDGYEREYSDHSGLTTVTTPVADVSESLHYMVEWGNTLPYSSYPGFFRVIVISRREGINYYTVTPHSATLAQAANYIEDLPEKLEAENPSIGGQVIALQVVFIAGSKEKLTKTLHKKSGKFRKLGLKSDKERQFEAERKRGKHPRIPKGQPGAG